MAAFFLKSLLIGYSGAVMPGSLLTYVINQSLHKGARTGFFAIVGHAILELALILAIFLGLSRLFAIDITRIIISFLGGALLIYFGITGIISALKKDFGLTADDSSAAHSDRRVVADGLLLSGSNPYFIIWWTTIGIVLLYEGYSLFGYIGVVVFTIGHLLADFTWYMLVSAMIAKSKKFLPRKAYRVIAAVLALALFGFGVKYIINGVQMII